MAGETIQPTSFSPLRRWRIVFSVLLSILAMAALVVMFNYLGARYFLRFPISAQSRARLSPQTVGLLKSITNEVRVVIYYNKAGEEEMYRLIKDLLEEYRFANPKIKIESVDYQLQSAKAQLIKTDFRLGTGAAKDLVLFESQERTSAVPGNLLGDYSYKTQIGGAGAETIVKRELLGFKGEQFFNASLLAVTTGKPLTARFLTGHNEYNPGDQSPTGFSGFRELLESVYVKPEMIDLLSINAVPTNTDLLIIAGQQNALTPGETEKIKQYLARNGARLLVLFDEHSTRFGTGLEPLLAEWGVDVGRGRIIDPNHKLDFDGNNFVVQNYHGNHPVVHPIIGQPLQVSRPRPVGKLKTAPDTPGAPKADEVALAAPGSYLAGDLTPSREGISLVVAVEKEREASRIVVVGDTICFDNQLLSSSSNCNEDFANSVINWLLARPQIMGNIGPRAVTEYRLMVTDTQMQTLLWVFLAGMPGGILVLGGLVWLRRRH